MDRASVTSGAAFKTAVRGTLILVAILILSGIVAFYYLQREMLGALETSLRAQRQLHRIRQNLLVTRDARHVDEGRGQADGVGGEVEVDRRR